MRFRITIRGDSDRQAPAELRGYLDGNLADLDRLSKAMQPFGIVVASGADPDYDPFEDWSH